MKEFTRLSLACAILAVCFLGLSETKVLILNKPLATVEYHVWYHNDPTDENAIPSPQKLDVASNAGNSFFSVMEAAKGQNELYYDFEYDEYPFGRLITSIGGFKEDPAQETYWMLYKLKVDQSPTNPPTDDELSPLGVDGTAVSEGDKYLFWRRKYQWKKQ